MQDIIVKISAIILGIFIAGTLILGGDGSGSMKDNTKEYNKQVSQEMKKVLEWNSDSGSSN